MIDISLYNSQSSGEKRSKEDPALNFNQLGHGDRTARGEIEKKIKIFKFSKGMYKSLDYLLYAIIKCKIIPSEG